jgi:hypothetical protein
MRGATLSGGANKGSSEARAFIGGIRAGDPILPLFPYHLRTMNRRYP